MEGRVFVFMERCLGNFHRTCGRARQVTKRLWAHPQVQGEAGGMTFD
jgi:hypothetical protein